MTARVKSFVKILAVAIVLSLIGAGANIYIKSLSPRETIQEEGLKIYVEGLSFYFGGDKISGTVYKPQDTTGRKPAVIWCHDLGESSKSGEKLCRAAAGKGYVAYAFDFRGGSPQSQSNGETLGMTLSSETKDLEAVIAKLRTLDYIDGNSIYLAGYSQGALIASQACGSKGVKGLILIAPAFNIPDQCNLLFPKNRQIEDSNDISGTMKVGKSYITDAKGMKPYKGLSRFKGDVLIVHGTSDQAVPLDYSVRAAGEFPNAELKTIDGAGHDLAGKTSSQVLGMVTAYLDTQKK